MVLCRQKVIESICHGRLDIAAFPGGWRISNRMETWGCFHLAPGEVPYRAGSCTSLEVYGNVAVPSGNSPLNYAHRTHSAPFAHSATKKERCQPCLQFPSSSFMVTLKSGAISIKIQSELIKVQSLTSFC